MFTLCVAFDIRDMQTDMEAGIATLPNIIGVKGSYRVMSVSMILFIVMSIIQYTRYPSLHRLIAEMVAAIATKLAIDYARKNPSDKAYLGLVDGMMLLYVVLVLWQ
jgi:1,4-dihydroxy-2-naphthoate octaprenyltransferase